jgi:hypothetical protein
MSDRLNGFNMVLALTESAVNSQFATIFKDGFIDPSKAVLPQNVEWDIPDGRGTIKAVLGAPKVSFMPNNNNYQNATFILSLLSGTFETYTIDTKSNTPTVKLSKKAISNWTVGFVVDLTKMAFGTAARNTAKTGGAINDKAHTALANYSDNLFDVNALIFDFASANIAAFDPNCTSLPGLTPDDYTSLSNALTVYFKKERKQPFIIAIHASSKKPAATATGVAPTLVPTGVSFTTFGNSTKPAQGQIGSLSTLNYLTTTDSHASLPAVPNGVFTAPFVTDNKSSGQLLISRASFVENYILKDFGKNLRAKFIPTGPRHFVSKNPSFPGISYYHDYGTFAPSVTGKGNTIVTTNATLSQDKSEINFTGTILLKASYAIQFIWRGTWTVWRQISFNGKVSIVPSADSHSINTKCDNFSFTNAVTTRNHKDLGANVDEWFTFGTIESMIDKQLNSITGNMRNWVERILDEGTSEIPNVFIPPTGDNYSMSPLNFNDSGDLVINVNIETK